MAPGPVVHDLRRITSTELLKDAEMREGLMGLERFALQTPDSNESKSPSEREVHVGKAAGAATQAGDG